MKEIPLSRGKVALIDDKDFELVNQFKWHTHTPGNNAEAFYARRTFCNGKERKRMYLHRFIINAPKDMQVDHINGNGLDNRRFNLRICTHSQNQRNQAVRKNGSSKFKGVYWYEPRKKWIANIRENKKKIHIGVYVDEVGAAKAYDEKAKKLFGEFARLNFPEQSGENGAIVQKYR